MKLLILLVLIFIALTSDASARITGPVTWPITRVLDGDTIQVNPWWLPKGLNLFIRIYGIDAPEIAPHASCPNEAQLGERAKALLAVNIATAKKIEFRDIDADKYGQRLVAKVLLDGKDIGKELIFNGLAHTYFGEKKIAGFWCKSSMIHGRK